jgi:hypothetical protein
MIADIPGQLLNSMSLPKPGTSTDKPRLSDAGRVQQIVALMIDADKERAITLATVKGMLDGNAPFDYTRLKEQGQGNRTNVNFREGEAMLSGAETPYYDLFAESSTYFQIESDETDPDKRTEYSRVMTQYFDDMLKDWSGFDYNIQRCIHEMVAFGRGFCLRPDTTSWHFTAVQQSRVLVPDGTVADPDQLEILVVRQSLTVSDLHCKIRNKESARKLGWNIKATESAIAGAVPETRNDTTTSDYEKIQEEIRNHDLYETMRSDVIRLAHVFVREFSGKVSHLIVEERNALEQRAVGGVPAKNVGKTEFLFKKIGRYNCFREVVSTFFFDIGDGTWHSVKGLGVKLYPFIEIKNRLKCSIVDNAFINLSILLQATSGRSEQETALMQLGQMTVLPANLELRQWPTQGRLEEGLFVERSLTGTLESNTGQYRRPMTRDVGNPASATQVNYDAIKEASLAKGAVNRFYTQLDCLGEETFRRATNFNLTPENNGRGPNSAALKFQQKCIDAGVPKSALKKIRYVRASRNSGNGSVFLRQQVVNQTTTLVPMMNEEGKQNWLDDSIAVMAGTENVARWNPKRTLNPSLQNDQAYAMLENDALRDGSPVMITSTQNAMIHSATHMKAATEAINSIPQGGDPMAVLSFLEFVGPHIAQHLQVMAGDQMRGRETKVLAQQLDQLGKITDDLRKKVMKQQQEQQAAMQKQQEEMAKQAAMTQQIMTNEQLRTVETQNKIQLSREKASTMMQLKRERQNQDMILKQQREDQGRALVDARTATDIRSQTAKTSADIALKTAKENGGSEKV